MKIKIWIGGIFLSAGLVGGAQGQGVVTFGRPGWPVNAAPYAPAPRPLLDYRPPIAPTPYPYAYPYISPTPYSPDFPATPAGGATPEVQIDSWYHRYLRRAVDPTGMQAHVQAYRRGGPESALAGLLGSAEYSRHWGNSAQGFVTGLYRDVLHREPHPGEVDGWARQLNRLSRTQLALEFLRKARIELGGPYY